MKKDTMPPTIENLTEKFRASFNPFQNQLEPSGYDTHLQKLAGHCLDHGLEDVGCIISLMKFAVQLSLYSPTVTFPKIEKAELDDYLMKKWQFRKELAILTSIFKNGRGITIEATMPDGSKEKHITLPIETNGLLQNMAFFSLNSLLAKEGLEYEMQGITQKKEKLDAETHEILLGYDFKEPYTDEELADIIKTESERISNETTMRGRKDWEIPKLGCMVHDFIEAGGDGLAALAPTEKYCLIGDLMLAIGVSPVEQGDWKDVLTNKEKADTVKNWEKSFLKASQKIR